MKHIGTQTLETDRLLLRKYEITDVFDMYRNWVADPEVSRFWGWKPHKNIEETKLLLQGWINDYTKTDKYHWVIAIKELSEAIGYIYLNDLNIEEKSASIQTLLAESSGIKAY
ncbi:MAG: N-acetyltransferase [Anaerocolumna sp.]|nr:N-acetyltransferase [Anaerocolumna sp.]